MAKYIQPEGENRPAGSLRGSTFQKCGNVFAIRKHNVPTDKKRLKQFTARNLFEHVQGRWRNLNPGQKNSFADETINYLRTNSLGDIYEMLPINLQNGTNTNLINAAESPINTMPNPVVCPVITPNNVLVNYAMSLAEFEMNTAIIPADFALFVFSQIPQPPGIDSMSLEQLRLFKIFSPGEDTSANIFTDYIATFGATSYEIGHKIFAIFQYVSLITGQKCENQSRVGEVE